MPSPDPAPRQSRTDSATATDARAVGGAAPGVLVRLGRAVGTSATRHFPWMAPHLLLIATCLLGALPLTLFTYAAGEVYDDVEDGRGLVALDRPVLDAALSARSPGLDTAVTVFTDLGGTLWLPILATLVVVLLAARWRSWTPIVLMASAAAGSLLMTHAGKVAIGRVRPPLVDAVPPYEVSPSFPSGHALNSTVVAGVLAYLVIRHATRAWQRVTAILLAGSWAGLMGASRVFLGHHWLTDVAMGWSLGLAWLTVVVLGHRVFLSARGARRARRADAR